MFITLLICFLLFVISLICSNYNIFSPSVITSGLWLVVMLLNISINHHLNPLTNKFFDAINLWVSFFCLSSLLMQALQTNNKKRIDPSPLTRNILYYVSLLTFPMLILKAYEITKIGGSSNWMFNLRVAAVGGIKGIDIEETSPFYVIIWYVSYLIELNDFSKKNRNRVFILLFLNLAFAFISMAKIQFLTLFLSTIFILYFKKVFRFKHILIGSILLVFVFLSIQMLRSGTSFSSERGHISENMVTTYLLSPPPAFEKTAPSSSSQFGENVFRFFYAIKFKLGLTNIKPVSTFLEFVNIGTGTNTYTTLYPFYKDFGMMGIGIFATILGLLMGYIYNKAEKRNLLFIILYSFLISQIVMQYAAELFFTNFSLNLKRFIITLLPFIMSKYEIFRLKKKQNSL